MRSALLSLVLLSVFASAGESRAQSAYDYPWCAVYANKSGAQACYYASYAQCITTMRGIGGYCIRSPYFRGEPYAERRTRRYYREY